MAYIEFDHVKKAFKQGSWLDKTYLNAVRDVTFSIEKGETVAVVGESGCGKTTLARMLTRLHTPTGGNITIDGKSISGSMTKAESKDFRKNVQMIFQDPFGSLNPAHKNGNIVGRAIEMYNPHMSSKEVREQVRALFEKVGLTPAEDFMEKLPGQLSGGQRQRIVIARALAVNPKIIACDEPTSMLDVSIGIEIMNLLLELKEREKLTYMFITHNLASARYMAEKIVVMYAGTDVEQGNMEDVIAQPLHPYTVLLLASTPEPYRTEQYQINASETLPDLTSNKPMCMFADRCPMATDRCRCQAPEAYHVGSRTVKCFLYENETEEKSKVSIAAYCRE